MQTITDIQKIIAPILKEYGVVHAEVFGSTVHGTTHPDSDIDLVVTLKEPIGLLKFFEMNRRLEEALGRKVDLATPASLNPHLMDRIKDDFVPVYEG